MKHLIKIAFGGVRSSYKLHFLTWYNIWMRLVHSYFFTLKQVIFYIVPVHDVWLISWVYVDFSSSSSILHCRVSHQCWLISCCDPVCLHGPAVDGDDDRCFMWHFSANNLLSYWFPAQIPCSALFQQMDIVPAVLLHTHLLFSCFCIFWNISHGH